MWRIERVPDPVRTVVSTAEMLVTDQLSTLWGTAARV